MNVNEYYGWLEGGIFCCDNQAYGLTKSLQTVRLGETGELIKEHPPEAKALMPTSRTRIRKKAH